jgi:hypothetical protein
MKTPEPTVGTFEKMAERFAERAAAVQKSSMPPLEGAMRREWVKQRQMDFQDFLMVSDCDITFEDGILQMTLDLRPAICDATMRKSPMGITDKGAEHETQAAMENIANALPTDGNKITPGMLDSKEDLQALIDGAEMFRVVETIEPINVNECPGSTLGVPAAPPAGPVGFSLTHGYLV